MFVSCFLSRTPDDVRDIIRYIQADLVSTRSAMAPSSSAPLPTLYTPEKYSQTMSDGGVIGERERECEAGRLYATCTHVTRMEQRCPTRSCMNKRYVTTHIEWCLNDLKCVRERITVMSHCGTAQFTLKLAASADLCPKRSEPTLNPQLRTYRRHGSEENGGKKHIVQISPLKHRWESKIHVGVMGNRSNCPIQHFST